MNGYIAISKEYLNVPYDEKEAAKILGAKWENKLKKWFAPPGSYLPQFSRWSDHDFLAKETTKLRDEVAKLQREKSDLERHCSELEAELKSLKNPTPPPYKEINWRKRSRKVGIYDKAYCNELESPPSKNSCVFSNGSDPNWSNEYNGLDPEWCAQQRKIEKHIEFMRTGC